MNLFQRWYLQLTAVTRCDKNTKRERRKSSIRINSCTEKGYGVIKIYLICRRGFRLKTTKTLVVIAVVVCLKSLSSISDLKMISAMNIRKTIKFSLLRYEISILRMSLFHGYSYSWKLVWGILFWPSSAPNLLFREQSL